ncbi:MAG: hypothetical protein QOE90_2095 [Thermoplasmata archaeon]|jgi:hypothetical protein|nr:hypothetical protein [Thermoplasmata archaeon]
MRLAPLVLLLALALAIPAALAQVPQTSPQVTLSLSASELRVDAGNESTLYANVSNPGSLAASVSLTLGALPGWDVRAEPRTFPLAAQGGTQMVILHVLAPAAGHGEARGPLDVGATLTEPNTGRTATAHQAATLARVDPPAPVPPPRTTPLQVGLFVAGSALVVAVVTYAEVRRRRALAAAWRERETGLALEVDGPLLPWGLRREQLQRVVVRNASERPRVAHLGIREAPEGWTAAISVPRLPLEPGERATITLYLNPGEGVPTGEPARVVLYARTAEALEHEERLGLDLVAPPVRIPTPDVAPTIAPRDGSAVRPALRR